MSAFKKHLPALILIALTNQGAAQEPENNTWPEFRGNNGNGNYDTMLIGIAPYNIDELETEGFTIFSLQSIEIESGQTETVKWDIRAPKGVTKEEYHIIEFYVTSEFSCRYETSGCNAMSQMITIYVRGVYLPGFEIVPSLAMLGFAAAVLARRNIEDDEEEAEWREAAPGL